MNERLEVTAPCRHMRPRTARLTTVLRDKAEHPETAWLIESPCCGDLLLALDDERAGWIKFRPAKPEARR